MSGERPGGWVEGIGWVAFLCELDAGTTVKTKGGEWVTKDRNTFAVYPVIVTRLADGSVPAPPVTVADERIGHIAAILQELANEHPFPAPGPVENALLAIADVVAPVTVADTTPTPEFIRCDWCGRHGHCGNVICEVCAEKSAPVPSPAPSNPVPDTARDVAFERWLAFELAHQEHGWPATNETTDAAQELAGAMAPLFASEPGLPDMGELRAVRDSIRHPVGTAEGTDINCDACIILAAVDRLLAPSTREPSE